MEKWIRFGMKGIDGQRVWLKRIGGVVMVGAGKYWRIGLKG